MDSQYQLAIGISISVLVLALIIAVYVARRKKQKQAELLGKQKLREAEAKNELVRQKELIARYGEELGVKIIAQSYFEGMTKEQVLEAKQVKPDKIELEGVDKKKETWIYGQKSSGQVFVFEDDVLVKFNAK